MTARHPPPRTWRSPSPSDQGRHPLQGHVRAPYPAWIRPIHYTAVIRLSSHIRRPVVHVPGAVCPIMPKHVYGTDPNIRQNPRTRLPSAAGRSLVGKPGDYIMLEKNKDFFH